MQPVNIWHVNIAWGRFIWWTVNFVQCPILWTLFIFLLKGHWKLLRKISVDWVHKKEPNQLHCHMLNVVQLNHSNIYKWNVPIAPTAIAPLNAWSEFNFLFFFRSGKGSLVIMCLSCLSLVRHRIDIIEYFVWAPIITIRITHSTYWMRRGSKFNAINFIII